MGRNEKPVDPTKGPAQELAYALQVLRRSVGEPTYRSMSRAVGLSPSVLSQASKGNRLPTLQVTLAFVRACGGDAAAEEEWRRRWEAVHAELARAGDLDPADEEPPVHEADSADEVRSEEDGMQPAPSAAGPPAPRPRHRALIAALLVAVIVLVSFSGVLLFLLLRNGKAGATKRPVGPIADGQDPYIHGCGHDQAPTDRQPIYRADGTRYGWIVLFVSPICSGAWGYVLGPNSAKWKITITAHRLTDGATTSYVSQADAGPNSWGNALSTRTGCVRAEATINDGPRAVTSCWRQDGPVTFPSKESRRRP